MIDNIILETDSYKLTHWNQYPEGTRGVYSYLEAREGAKYPKTLFFGLQSILKQLENSPVTTYDLDEAFWVTRDHIGPGIFNAKGWNHIIGKHGGRLPVRIKAVAEGTVVETGNVLMTIENTDPACYWLPNALESLLLHVWYPSTVATVSYHVKQKMKAALARSAEDDSALPFMLHDFGYRGASSSQTAAIGGSAHIVNFMGSDTLPAIRLLNKDYGAGMPAFSVPATEHSVMTGLGPAGEMKIVTDLLDTYPKGILSVVADSYDVYRFVQRLAPLKERIMAREGKFVVRPDSVTLLDSTPELLCVRLLGMMHEIFGGRTNAKGYTVLDSHVGLLWGDGIDPEGIDRILGAIMAAGYSAENMVFGMGGGLLQKVNRDTQNFAFKCSAQKRNGVWVPVNKGTHGKKSKSGRLKLVNLGNEYATYAPTAPLPDELEVVFENGRTTGTTTFKEVRARVR